MNEKIDRLFLFFVTNRAKIIFVFKIWFILMVTFLIIGGNSIYSVDDNFQFFYSIGRNAGKISLIFYIFTITPGIAKRFSVKNKLISIIMIYRRYLGITMFLFLLVHFWFLVGINMFFKNLFIIPTPLFQTFGLIAYLLLLPMFITSNDFSVTRLGKWWYRIHKLTYIIVWFIFFHTALQRLSIWSTLAGLGVTLELASYIYSRLKKNSSASFQN